MRAAAANGRARRCAALLRDAILTIIGACLIDLALCAAVAVLVILVGEDMFVRFWTDITRFVAYIGPFTTIAACVSLGFVLCAFALVLLGDAVEKDKNDTEHTK